MKPLPRLTLAAVLLWPLTACESTKKTAEAEDQAEQYEMVTTTGSILPKRVRKSDPKRDGVSIESGDGPTRTIMERRALNTIHSSQQGGSR
jgi:hypothetical protein